MDLRLAWAYMSIVDLNEVAMEVLESREGLLVGLFCVFGMAFE